MAGSDRDESVAANAKDLSASSFESDHRILEHKNSPLRASQTLDSTILSPQDTEPAYARPSEIEWQSTENLLRLLFKHNGKPMAVPSQTCARRSKSVFASKIGRDFVLSIDGVEFDVHAAFLLGGSRVLEQYLSVIDSTGLRTSYTFDPNLFTPIMVDRYVSFIYTGTINMDQKGRATTLHHATRFPPDFTSKSYPMEIKLPIHFYMTMYGMGERLQDQTLMSSAYAKMAEDMLFKSPLPRKAVLSIIGWTYGSAEGICVDEDGALRKLVVACVIRHVQKEFWVERELRTFTEQAAQYPEFTNDLDSASEAFEWLIGSKSISKGSKRTKRARTGKKDKDQAENTPSVSD